MRYLKTFENIYKPEIGDYVQINTIKNQRNRIW